MRVQTTVTLHRSDFTWPTKDLIPAGGASCCILADVTQNRRGFDGKFEVEIVSVLIAVNGSDREVLEDLTADAEKKIEPTFITLYMGSKRRGFEGDGYQAEEGF